MFTRFWRFPKEKQLVWRTWMQFSYASCEMDYDKFFELGSAITFRTHFEYILIIHIQLARAIQNIQSVLIACHKMYLVTSSHLNS